MSTLIYSSPRFQAFDKDGRFLAYGRLTVLDAGTLDLKNVYDSDGSPVANPMILNSEGKVIVDGISTDDGNYKLVYERRNSNGTYTEVDVVDDIPNSTSGSSSSSATMLGSIADLRALPHPSGLAYAIVASYYLNGGIATGRYYFNPTSTLPDDNGYVIRPGSMLPEGAWIRTFEGMDIDPYMWGCIPDSASDDNQTRMTQLFQFASENPQYRIIFPKGKWYCSGDLTVNSSIKIEYGASIEKVELIPSVFTFGPNAVVEMSHDNLFCPGEGYKYSLYFDDNAKTVDDLVSFSWVSESCNIVTNNNISMYKFLTSANNFMGGIVLNKYHYIDLADIMDLSNKVLVIKDGGQLWADAPSTISLPKQVIDQRTDKSSWAFEGEFETQVSPISIPVSVFMRNGVGLDSYSRYSATGGVLEIDADFDYSGSTAVLMGSKLTIKPAGGVFSNTSGNTVTIRSKVDGSQLWIVPSSSISFIESDIKLSWFYDPANISSTFAEALRWGNYIDLDGKTWDFGILNFIITSPYFLLKNGNLNINGYITLYEYTYFGLKDCTLNLTASNQITMYPANNDVTINHNVDSSSFVGSKFVIHYVTGGVVGPPDTRTKVGNFVFHKFTCGGEFIFDSDLLPLETTDMSRLFPAGYTRLVDNCAFVGDFFVQSLASVVFQNNEYGGVYNSFITVQSVTVQNNRCPSGQFIVGGTIENEADGGWKLYDVKFLNNEFVYAYADLPGGGSVDAGIFPNDYQNIRSNYSTSVFKGNYCSATPSYGIANNEIEYSHEWEGATLPVGGSWVGGTRLWYLGVSGHGDTSVVTSSTDDEVLVHTMDCKKGDKHFLCFGRQSVPTSSSPGSTTLGGCLQKDVVVNGTMYFRQIVPSLGPWSVGSVTTPASSDYFEAPTFRASNENQMWRWPSDDDDGVDIGYSPKVSFRLRGYANAGNGFDVTSAAGVRIVLAGPVKV